MSILKRNLFVLSEPQTLTGEKLRAMSNQMNLAVYIQRDLQNQIDRGELLPEKFTLGGLADHYNVSFSPVRQAIRILIEDDYLEKLSNGRLQVNKERLGSQPDLQPLAEVIPTQGWDEKIAEEVIQLSFQGQETFLREEATADQFGIGRTMIRQVFNRLAGQGLLEHIPRRGWKVRLFNEFDMHAYLEIRETLELKALELARPKLDPEVLQTMLDANRPPLRRGSKRLDNRLHNYLIEKAGNIYIKDFFDRHGIYYSTLFEWAAPETRVELEMARQHCEILEAMIAGNWSEARTALSKHIRSQEPIVRQLIQDVANANSED